MLWFTKARYGILTPTRDVIYGPQACILNRVDETLGAKWLTLNISSFSSSFSKEPCSKVVFSTLGLVATRVFNVHLLNVVVFSKKILWFAQTNVITLKTQTHEVNAR